MNKSSRSGFTLIELLVVIAIIGILASIILASLDTARKKGRDARRISDMKQVQLALELFYDANGSQYSIGAATPFAFAGVLTTDLVPAYIAAMPQDPTNSGVYVYKYVGTTSNLNTTACAAGTCSSYILRAVTEVAQAGYIATNGTALTGFVCTPSAGVNYCVQP